MINFETRISYISQLENGIVRVQMKEDIELTPEDIDENQSIYKRLLEGQDNLLFLLVFPPGGQSSSESRDRYANPDNAKIKRAEALVVETLAHRLEIKFYQNYYKPAHPVEAFSNEKEAIDWLLTFRDMPKMDTYETTTSFVSFLPQNVVRIQMKEGAVLTLKTMRENLELYKSKLTDKASFLSIFHDSNTAEFKIKKSFEDPERIALKKAESFVLNHLGNRIELEYYINNTKLIYPTKVFKEEKKAIDWLTTV